MGAYLYPPANRVAACIPPRDGALARPELSVRGATGWLVTRGKCLKQREGEKRKKYQQQINDSSRPTRSECERVIRTREEDEPETEALLLLLLLLLQVEGLSPLRTR